jgi:hypothetical protein
MEAVRIGSPSNPMFITPLYTMSPVKVSGIALLALSLLVTPFTLTVSSSPLTAKPS